MTRSGRQAQASGVHTAPGGRARFERCRWIHHEAHAGHMNPGARPQKGHGRFQAVIKTGLCVPSTALGAGQLSRSLPRTPPAPDLGRAGLHRRELCPRPEGGRSRAQAGSSGDPEPESGSRGSRIKPKALSRNLIAEPSWGAGKGVRGGACPGSKTF